VVFLWLGRAYGLQARRLGAPGGAGPARNAKVGFEKAIALDPDLIDAREHLVQFYLEAPWVIGGSRRLALAEVEKIKKRDLYSGLLIHGEVLLNSRKYADAQRLYEQAAGINPQKVDAYYRLGKLFIATKQFQKAFEAFDKVEALNAKEELVRYYIGKTGALSGEQLPRAEAALKAYLQTKPWYIMPQLSAAHFYLGKIYERQQKIDAARAEYQSALELEPDYVEAKTGLKRLGR
jgi:tetratricopeptide (TPR) repeat protein